MCVGEGGGGCVRVSVCVYVPASMGACGSLHVCMRARVYVPEWKCT